MVNTKIRLIIFFAVKDVEVLYSQEKQDQELTLASDHELFIAKLKKVGKITRPCRHNLNQIPNEYTVEVRNRFKRLDLIDRVPDEPWTEVCTEDRDQDPSPLKRNAKKQNSCLGRPYK